MGSLIWLRAEEKADEHRSPISPLECEKLIEAGYQLVVERSAERAFDDVEYERAGAEMRSAGAWREAPEEAWILGLKELPEAEFDLGRRHIHFGHVFKGQNGWQSMVARFARGGGTLYDLENLADENGRRIAAFGYWAGYVGAALGLAAWAGRQQGDSPGLDSVDPVESKDELLEKLALSLEKCSTIPTVLITGALGRCGSGATDLCTALGIKPTRWDMAETADGGPFPQILQHDIFVNCVLASPQTPVFVPKSALQDPGRKLSVIADVSCDPESSYNPIPIYNRSTTFREPTIVVGPASGDGASVAGREIEIMAIDHLPSHLPRESSQDFASLLLPALLDLENDASGIWARAKEAFDAAVRRLDDN